MGLDPCQNCFAILVEHVWLHKIFAHFSLQHDQIMYIILCLWWKGFIKISRSLSSFSIVIFLHLWCESQTLIFSEINFIKQRVKLFLITVGGFQVMEEVIRSCTYKLENPCSYFIPFVLVHMCLLTYFLWKKKLLPDFSF